MREASQDISGRMRLSPKGSESLWMGAQEAFRKEFASMTRDQVHLRAMGRGTWRTG